MTSDDFRNLAKLEHQPMYIHCTNGRYCNGTMCYSLEGILGVPKEDYLRGSSKNMRIVPIILLLACIKSLLSLSI